MWLDLDTAVERPENHNSIGVAMNLCHLAHLPCLTRHESLAHELWERARSVACLRYDRSMYSLLPWGGGEWRRMTMVREMRRSLTGGPWRMQLQGSSCTFILGRSKAILCSSIAFCLSCLRLLHLIHSSRIAPASFVYARPPDWHAAWPSLTRRLQTKLPCDTFTHPTVVRITPALPLSHAAPHEAV